MKYYVKIKSGEYTENKIERRREVNKTHSPF